MFFSAFAIANRKESEMAEIAEVTVDKNLLIHWWRYYGRDPYTLEELAEFERIIDQYGAERVLDVAFASYVCEDGSSWVILTSIRENAVEQLFDVVPSCENIEGEDQKTFSSARKEFVRLISDTMQ